MKICYLGKMGWTHKRHFLDYFSKLYEVHNFDIHNRNTSVLNNIDDFEGKVQSHSLLRNKSLNSSANHSIQNYAKGLQVLNVAEKYTKISQRVSLKNNTKSSILSNYRKILVSYLKSKALKYKLKRINPDIIHAFGANTWWATELSKIKGSKTVLTCMGSDILRYPIINDENFRLVYRNLHAASHIHVTSPHMRDSVSNNFDINSDKISLIHWGTPLGKLESSIEDLGITKNQLGIKDDDIVLLYIKGFRDASRQNYLRLLEGFKPLVEDNKKVKLIMMSYGHVKPNPNNRYLDIISFIKENNLEQNVIVVNNWVSDQNLANIFSISDIGIALEDTDAFSLGILDIMKYDIIPILSDIKTYRDYFIEGKNCLFVNQKDPINMHKALQKSITKINTLKTEIIPKNHIFLRTEMDNKIQMNKINEMYEQILETNSLEPNK